MQVTDADGQALTRICVFLLHPEMFHAVPLSFSPTEGVTNIFSSHPLQNFSGTFCFCWHSTEIQPENNVAIFSYYMKNICIYISFPTTSRFFFFTFPLTSVLSCFPQNSQCSLHNFPVCSRMVVASTAKCCLLWLSGVNLNPFPGTGTWPRQVCQV